MEYLLHDENKIIKVYTDFRLLDWILDSVKLRVEDLD